MHPLLYHEPVIASDGEQTAVRWVGSMQSLQADRDELRRRGAGAAAMAADCWSWDFRAARYAEIIRQTLAGRTASK